MTGPEQAILKRIGDEGCYLMSLKRAADRFNSGDSTFDILDLYDRLTKTKIRENDREVPIMERDCYLNRAEIALAIMTGVKWSLTHEPAAYKASQGEIVIARYEWSGINHTTAHFVLDMEDGSIYDPLGWSNTVANGKRVSTRVFRRIL
jgi:hypothetical protein